MQATTRGQHAVVLGASMSGMLAARALCEHFSRVTLVERDTLPQRPENRKGVPQGRHTHTLLAGGVDHVETYFPHLRDELIAAGAPFGDPGMNSRMIASGYRCTRVATGARGVNASRPLLEHIVRNRLRACPQIRVLERQRVIGLRMGPTGHYLAVGSLAAAPETLLRPSMLLRVLLHRLHRPGTTRRIPAGST